MGAGEEGLEAEDLEAGNINHAFEKSDFESTLRTKSDKEKTMMLSSWLFPIWSRKDFRADNVSQG